MMSSSYITTTVDLPDEDDVKVEVHFSYDARAGELDEVEVRREDNKQDIFYQLTEQQKKDLYEELWDSVRQDEDGPY